MFGGFVTGEKRPAKIHQSSQGKTFGRKYGTFKARRSEHSFINGARAAKETDFRCRFDGSYLLGHSQRRINMAPRAAAGEVKTFAIRFRASLHCHEVRVCPKPAHNASLFPDTFRIEVILPLQRLIERDLYRVKLGKGPEFVQIQLSTPRKWQAKPVLFNAD